MYFYGWRTKLDQSFNN